LGVVAPTTHSDSTFFVLAGLSTGNIWALAKFVHSLEYLTAFRLHSGVRQTDQHRCSVKQVSVLEARHAQFENIRMLE